MATFTIGEQVPLSTDSIRSSAVTNLGASKLTPRFIGPFRVMKVNREAYTLDIPTSLRLHPKFYVGRLKKYNPATVPSATDPPASTPERRANAPPDAPPASLTAAAVPPSAVPRRHAAPTPASAPVTPDLTGEPLQAPFSPERPEPSSPQPLPERLEHDSSQLRHPPGSSRCARYSREPPPLIVDSAGHTCWIVDRLVGHEDPPRATSSTRHVRAPHQRAGFLPRGVTECAGLDIHLKTIRGSHVQYFSGMSRMWSSSMRARLRARAPLTPILRRAANASPQHKHTAGFAVMIKNQKNDDDPGLDPVTFGLATQSMTTELVWHRFASMMDIVTSVHSAV
ncbi:unnamed protein product [Phytophthora fragariaefolia]|uniref:Unnamed protein product n=1 Tax=Phytophthora fragariaefolia TaxID=1490495 RepID=A0A9W6YCX0_9STRA|nr:unnamed protein product [Phytophthora fragariaefolia]